MEEILASIRRIIAGDQEGRARRVRMKTPSSRAMADAIRHGYGFG